MGAQKALYCCSVFLYNAEALINKTVQHFFVNAAPFILLFFPTFHLLR